MPARPPRSDTSTRVRLPTSVRVDVLVAGAAGTPERRGVQPALVRERRGPHVRVRRVRRQVDQLGDVARHRGQPLHATLGQRRDAHLQGQVGDDRHQVGVAGALAVAVDRPLHVGRAADDRRDGVGHRAAGVVLGVDPDRHAVEVADDLTDDPLDLVRQRAAVGVAQHQAVRTLGRGGLEHARRVLGVGRL